MTDEHTSREKCPECGSEKTEFIQFASGDEETVETDPDEVGDGLLELRYCMDCKYGIEIVLTPETHNTVPPDPKV